MRFQIVCHLMEIRRFHKKGTNVSEDTFQTMRILQKWKKNCLDFWDAAMNLLLLIHCKIDGQWIQKDGGFTVGPPFLYFKAWLWSFLDNYPLLVVKKIGPPIHSFIQAWGTRRYPNVRKIWFMFPLTIAFFLEKVKNIQRGDKIMGHRWWSFWSHRRYWTSTSC